MTKNQLISDIILRITKGKPSDDLELEPSQVEFWLQIVLNQYISTYILNNTVPGGTKNFFVKRETCKILNTEDLYCVDDNLDRNYITLCKPIMETLGDNAIIRVVTSNGYTVRRTSLVEIDFVENIEFVKPSLDNLVFYRDGRDKLVICGLPKALSNDIGFIVWYIPEADLSIYSADDELPIPGEFLPAILDDVEALARRQMYGVADVENDAQDDLPNVGAQQPN